MLKTSIFTFYHEKSHITISTTIPLYCTVLQYCTAHFYLAVQPGVSSSGIQQGQEELGEKGRANDLSPPHGPWIHSVFHHVGLQVLCLAPGPKGRLRPGQSQGLLYKHLCCRTPDQTNKKKPLIQKIGKGSIIAWLVGWSAGWSVSRDLSKGKADLPF